MTAAKSKILNVLIFWFIKSEINWVFLGFVVNEFVLYLAK